MLRKKTTMCMAMVVTWLIAGGLTTFARGVHTHEHAHDSTLPAHTHSAEPNEARPPATPKAEGTTAVTNIVGGKIGARAVPAALQHEGGKGKEEGIWCNMCRCSTANHAFLCPQGVPAEQCHLHRYFMCTNQY